MKQIEWLHHWKHIDPYIFNRRWLAGLCLAGLTFTACDDSETTPPAPATTQSSGSQLPGDTTYNYQTKINFSQGGDAARYQVSGWGEPELEGTWTIANSAKLSFTVPPSKQDVVFKATMSGFTKAPELPSQSVDVFVNGQQAAHWEIAVKGLVQLLIPASAVQDGRLEIEFKLAKAASPASLGISADQRQLGLRFYDLELVAPPAP